MALHHFPIWLSRFIGREKDKTEVESLLDRTRLLTLTGPGGSGKTRLGVEVAKEIEDCYLDGVWLVELAPISQAGPLPQIIANALGLSENPGQPIIDRLVDHLRTKQLLLVLDNCEHLVEHCAKLVHLLLTSCPELQILATSREPLNIAGETVWLVPPLSLPDWQPDLPLEELLLSESVQLFLDRARAIRSDFAFFWPDAGFDRAQQTEAAQTARDIVKICRQLDGIPLALELAAARINIISVHEMAERMSDAFQWLSSRDRLAPARQQTLKATLDWSYRLLREEEQILFRRLAVFNGGFTLDAINAVCTGRDSDPAHVLDLLSCLVDKSFVESSRDTVITSRYRLLEVVRQYAQEHLSHSGEETAIREQHLAWCLEFAQQADAEIVRAGRAERGNWVIRFETEMPNLRQAFAWSQNGSRQPELGHQLATCVASFCQMRGYFLEGLDWFRTLLSHPEGIAKRTLAESYEQAGFFAQHLWDFEVARQYYEQSLALYRESSHMGETAYVLGSLGWVYERIGSYEKAQQLAEESLIVLQQVDPETSDATSPMILMLLGDLAYIRGDYAQSADLVAKGIELNQKTGDRMLVNRRITRMAQIAVAQGDLARSRSLLFQSLNESVGTGDRWNAAMILVTLVNLAAAQGDLFRAAKCIGAVQAFLEGFGTNLWPVDRIIFEKHLRLVKAELKEATFETARNQGLHLGSDVEQALAFAATVLATMQRVEESARTLPITKSIASSAPIQATRQAYDGLTTREREVAALIARGKTNAEIAATLFLGVRTIEAHVTKILNKLGYTSRTQIAAWVVEKGLNQAESR